MSSLVRNFYDIHYIMKYAIQAAVALSSGIFAAAKLKQEQESTESSSRTSNTTNGNIHNNDRLIENKSSTGSVHTKTLNQVYSELRVGRKLQEACADCHTVDGVVNIFGPNIFSEGRCVFGSKAGTTDPEFEYSETMKASDFIWTELEVNDWLSDTHKYMAGTFMIFDGVQDPQERIQIIQWIKDTCGDALPEEYKGEEWKDLVSGGFSKYSPKIVTFSAAVVTGLVMMGGRK